MRKCNQYEWKTVGKDQAEELADMSEHLVTHNPSPAMWAVAYKIIQQSRDRRKVAE